MLPKPESKLEYQYIFLWKIVKLQMKLLKELLSNYFIERKLDILVLLTLFLAMFWNLINRNTVRIISWRVKMISFYWEYVYYFEISEWILPTLWEIVIW